jgi:sortase (surface protein transpeptidase)
MGRKQKIRKISKIYNVIGVTILVLGFLLMLIPVFPYVWYVVNPEATGDEITTLSGEIIPEQKIPQIENPVNDDPLPFKDTSLPEQPHIIIEKINVNSPIGIGDNYIESLKVGSWMVPEYGDPIDNAAPIIIASHRFGYSSWGTEKREKISFYNLPSTDKGDLIEIIWDQRKFYYVIYKAEESTFISDYEADLILYTCKFFNSPIRIFRYAQAVN